MYVKTVRIADRFRISFVGHVIRKIVQFFAKVVDVWSRGIWSKLKVTN